MAEETTEWCMGLPLVQRRELDEQERQALQRQLRLLRWRVPGILLLFGAIAGTIYAIAQAVSSTEQDRQIAVSLGYVIFYFVFAPALLLLIYDVLRRRKAWTRELNTREVRRFAGVFQPEPGAKALLQTLRHARFAPNKTTGAWSIETLAGTGRLWRVQDQPVRVWRTMPFLRVAQTPEVAAVAAQWLQPMQHEGKETLYGQREMSLSEQEELRRFARRLCWRFVPIALVLTLSLGTLIGLIVMRYPIPAIAARGYLVFLIFVTVSVDATAAKALKVSRRMWQDAQKAQIAIVRVDAKVIEEVNRVARMDAKQRKLHNIKKTEADTKEKSIETGEDSEATHIVVEVLPLTQRRWTEAGRPSSWRVANSAS